MMTYQYSSTTKPFMKLIFHYHFSDGISRLNALEYKCKIRKKIHDCDHMNDSPKNPNSQKSQVDQNSFLVFISFTFYKT